MTELREKLNNIVEDYNACKVLAESVGNPSVYEGTTATASDLVIGKTAYSNGEFIEGILDPEGYLAISVEEPTGENKPKFWVKRGKNLCRMSFFSTHYTSAGGMSVTINSDTIKVSTQWKNPWTGVRFKTIDLRGLEGQLITFSIDITTTNSVDYRVYIGTCDAAGTLKEAIDSIYESITSNRIVLQFTVADTITEDAQFLCIFLGPTASATPTIYNTYVTFAKPQIEIGEATEYEANYDQKLYIKNKDNEYVIFDAATEF